MEGSAGNWRGSPKAVRSGAAAGGRARKECEAGAGEATPLQPAARPRPAHGPPTGGLPRMLLPRERRGPPTQHASGQGGGVTVHADRGW